MDGGQSALGRGRDGCTTANLTYRLSKVGMELVVVCLRLSLCLRLRLHPAKAQPCSS